LAIDLPEKQAKKKSPDLTASRIAMSHRSPGLMLKPIQPDGHSVCLEIQSELIDEGGVFTDGGNENVRHSAILHDVTGARKRKC
jgi:hypothetical protein